MVNYSLEIVIKYANAMTAKKKSLLKYYNEVSFSNYYYAHAFF